MLVEQQDTVYQVNAVVKFVFDENQCMSVAQAFECAEEALGCGGVEVGRWFVEDEHLWVHCKSAGQRKTLLLSAGKTGEMALAQVGDANACQGGVDASVHLIGWHSQVFETEGYFVGDVECAELAFGILKDDADLLG